LREREIEPVNQEDKHPTGLKPYDRKVDVQDRAKDPMIYTWEWSDLIDLTPNPHTTHREPQGPKSIAMLSYTRLRTSSKPSRNKIDLQKFAKNTWGRNKHKPMARTLTTGTIVTSGCHANFHYSHMWS